jgi:hypothetical protein
MCGVLLWRADAQRMRRSTRATSSVVIHYARLDDRQTRWDRTAEWMRALVTSAGLWLFRHRAAVAGATAVLLSIYCAHRLHDARGEVFASRLGFCGTWRMAARSDFRHAGYTLGLIPVLCLFAIRSRWWAILGWISFASAVAWWTIMRDGI